MDALVPVFVPPRILAMRSALVIAYIFLGLLLTCSPTIAGPSLPEDQSMFLVATEQLDNTSFQEAVILITHNSPRGATGLTINRPTDIALQKVFPHVQQFRQTKGSLFLGGPVSTNAIFVLLRTDQPTQNMHRIARNIYFSTAQNAFSHPFITSSRIYAGYTGWAPGQLQSEIDRGDWILVHTDSNIIFENEPGDIWQRLNKRWSGLWL
jgi:putative transcriptional regulator